MDEHRRARDRYWRFVPDINTGHLLQIAVLAIGIFSAYATLDKRVTMAEQRMTHAEMITRDSAARVKDELIDIKSEVRELRRGIEDLKRAVKP